MTEPSKAVFLSYASQDAEAAKRICDALRAAGIEVWFDQSELRGGDAWDQSIRKQIKTCALFVPIISANTHAREEGYFRLEWKLAVDRSHLMTGTKAFLLPVVIDDTRDDDEQVPDKFREVQWTRLPAGETPPAFVERVSRLLSPESAHAPGEARSPAAPHMATASGPPAPTPAASRRTQRVLLVIAAAVVISVGYFAVDKFVLSKRGTAVAHTSATALSGVPAPTAIPEKSIAVLPFADMSEKKDQEYFSDGLTEELLDLLAQVPELKVPARTSSFYFKGKQVTIAEIAKALGVAHVLEGSVRKAGKTIRVTAQLIRADNGYHLWSKTYDRDLKDIFKVQDEIAAAVVEALKANLLVSQPASNSHRSASTEAYNQYLLGRSFFGRETGNGWPLAVAAYRKAVALDPNYAAAYAGLAFSEYYAADSIDDPTGWQRAQAAADKAVALAPALADGYAARALVRSDHFHNWSGAQADLEKALALDPGDAVAQRRYAELLANFGRLPEALASATRATELDPLSDSAWVALGITRYSSGLFPEARQALSRALWSSPDFTDTSEKPNNAIRGVSWEVAGSIARSLNWKRCSWRARQA